MAARYVVRHLEEKMMSGSDLNTSIKLENVKIRTIRSQTAKKGMFF